MIRRYLFATDVHWGYEIHHGHKRPIHDPAAISVLMQFMEDFKPHDIILGGDILDCGPIARHHNKGKPRKTEGLRLQKDAEECQTELLKPLDKLGSRDGFRTFIIGNHCDWIDDLLDEDPALEGLVNVKQLLQLDRWKVVSHGGGFAYHKLYFIHGDTIRGGEHCARRAVVDYGRNIRFGHFHTLQKFTMTSPIDTEVARTGVAVPCLCSKDVGYMERIPNRWVQGFSYGWVDTDSGIFGEQIAVIIRGQSILEGRLYRG